MNQKDLEGIEIGDEIRFGLHRAKVVTIETKHDFSTVPPTMVPWQVWLDNHTSVREGDQLHQLTLVKKEPEGGTK